MKKTLISRYEVGIRIITFLLVVATLLLAGDQQLAWIKIIALIVAFTMTIKHRKYFFPYTMGAVACYIFATLNELWGYSEALNTKLFFTAGDILFPLGVISFVYRITYKYKIVKDESIYRE